MSDDPRLLAAAGQPRGALARSLPLGLVVLYGLGVTIGAGIYVLVGLAAAKAGSSAPLAFIIAAAVMGFTAASFAEFAGRMPVSAGEAAFVLAGFGSKAMSTTVGLLVIAAGIIAAAAITTGSVGYISVFVNVPPTMLAVLVLLVMGGIAARGMLMSAWVAAVMTLIEVGGLVFIIAVGLAARPEIIQGVAGTIPTLGDGTAWFGLLGATLLAFFAFIGFEGLVNIAEEVHEPERTLPRAIFLTLVLSTILYILVVVVAMAWVSREELAGSAAPLALVFERVTGAPPYLVAAIAIVATLNGIIAQIILAARVAYGLAVQGALPARLGDVHPWTRTPLLATALVTLVAILLAVTLPIDRLAEWTSRLMLGIFALVNASLVLLKRRGDVAPPGTFVVPVIVPVLGVLSSIALLLASAFG
jgi:APA family basic amino acid/polyamine antiporter